MSNDTVNANRRIRVFISSTFRDMIEERDELMTHTWPELRRFCQERHVELVEVDLRWGIAEEQSARKETLKLCLDEIRACRPFFIGLLGERYGWIPGDNAFTADLREEQPWLRDLHGKSVTELEILHGVLNNPEMAGRAFFYFRDSKYVESVPADKKTDFTAENAESAEKLKRLKDLIRARFGVPPSGGQAGFGVPPSGGLRATSPTEPAEAGTPNETPRPRLRENYHDPVQLAAFVLEDLKAVIEAQFPKENIPDPLAREALDHEAFAETRRRTYIGRPDYFEALDRHAAGGAPPSPPSEGGEGRGEVGVRDTPLVLLGESGSGKSALLANWVERWRKEHPRDFIFQHYIGGTPDSAEHWRLMTRLIAEIKRWTADPEELPRTHDDLLKTFPVWLAKARIKAEHEGVRFILVLDALNQLVDQNHARLLGWLPEHPFTGPLRLIVSTLPDKSGADDVLEAVQKRRWRELRVEPLTVEERRRMIADYLARFGKTLDEHRVVRLATAAPAANPLFLKILLDDLRVTGTYKRLDERLTEYLSAADIPALLKQVLTRYQRDYERDRPSLVSEALGLIWAARRGLTEAELLRLLKPANLPQLPLAVWTPLRSALEEGLVDHGGILNFAHDFLRTAVATAVVPDEDNRDALRLRLADDFERQPVSARSCDELPWLLKETDSLTRLRACLLDIDRFLLIRARDEEELRRYWVEQLREQQTMGKAYLGSFDLWRQEPDCEEPRIANAANELALFLLVAALSAEAEPLLRRALAINEHNFGKDHPRVATGLNNLAQLLRNTNRMAEAEPLMRRALDIDARNLDPKVAYDLNNLALLFHHTNRLAEAEQFYRRALEIGEYNFGKDHPEVVIYLNNLAQLLNDTNRLAEAEPLMRRALESDERSLGPEHPQVATCLNNLAVLLTETNRLAEAEPLYRRALEIDEQSFGKDHPEVARCLNNLAALLQETNRLAEAEPLMRRALAIDEHSFGKDHPKVATDLIVLAGLLQTTNRLAEAEPLYRRALEIDEVSFGKDHPEVATNLNALAGLLHATNRLTEAEPLMRRALAIDEKSFGKDHPKVATDLIALAGLLQTTNRLAEAEPLYRRALEIDEHSCGKDHPKVATDLNNLAQLFKATNRLAEAEPLMRRTLEILDSSLGSDHPSVATLLINLAGLLRATNRLAEAEPLMRRALEIDEHSLGRDHTDVAKDLSNLAGLFTDTDRLRSLSVFFFEEKCGGIEHGGGGIGR